MNKSPQHNQQTEPKQCKSEVEEISIFQSLESAHHSIYIWKKIVCSNKESQAAISESSHAQWCFIQQNAQL